MAVPHFLHVFATFVAGGPQVRTAALINALGDRVRHTVIPMDGRSDARDLIDPSVSLEVLDPPASGSMLASVRALRQQLVQLQPDLLLTYNWGSIEMAMAARTRRGCRHIHHEDGFLPDEANGFKSRRILIRRGVLRGGDGLIVPSHVLQSIALERWKVAPAKLHLIPNGIDLERFAPRDAAGEARGAALRAKLGIDPNAQVVGYCGHLRPEKNPLRLLQAALYVPDDRNVEYLILGDGPERAEMERFLASGGRTLRVHFAGHSPDPRPFYEAMDVFGISSNTEQMPVALVEAMACGLPVVSTDVGDVAHMLPPSNAPYVVPLHPSQPTETARALGDAMAELLSDEAVQRELGASGRARAERQYGFATMLDAHSACFERALGRSLDFPQP